MEYPDDVRNQQNATALSSLVKNLKALPTDHQQLRDLWRHCFGLKGPNELDMTDDPLPWIDAEQELLRGYGFHDQTNGNPEAFLEDYIRALVQEENA